MMVEERQSSNWISYDWFKLIVAAILVLLLFSIFLNERNTRQANRQSITAPIAATAVVPAATAPTLDLPTERQPGRVILRGTGAPATQIEVLIDGTRTGIAQVDTDGNWALPITLTAGDYEVVARSLDAAGNPTASSSAAQLNIAAPPLAIDTPVDGSSVSAGESVTISGTGAPGETVELLAGDAVVATTTIGADGNWSLDYTPSAAGPAELSVQVAGTATSTALALTVEPAPVDFAVDTPADGTSVTAGESVTISGTGTPGETVELLAGDAVVATTTIGADGNWSLDYTPSAAGPAELSVQLGGAEIAAATLALTVEPAAAQAEPAPAEPAPTAPAAAVQGPVDIVVVFDRSSSMQTDGKIEAARDALINFTEQLSDDARLQIISFSRSRIEVTPLTPLGEKRATLPIAINNITPDGPTFLYDTIIEAYQSLAANSDPSRFRAIVVLTDGRDERITEDGEVVAPASSVTLDNVVVFAQNRSGGDNPIRLFTIAYGNQADVVALQRLADAGAGRYFSAGPETVRQVYDEIAQFLQ